MSCFEVPQVCRVTCCGRTIYEKHRAGRKHRPVAAAATAACGTLHRASMRPARECDADALLAGLLAHSRNPSEQGLLLSLEWLTVC